MEKIITELKNSLTDDQFLEFYEKIKQQVELIKKQKRLNEIDQKFREIRALCVPIANLFIVLKMVIIPKENKNIYVKNVVLVLMLFVIILVIRLLA